MVRILQNMPMLIQVPLPTKVDKLVKDLKAREAEAIWERFGDWQDCLLGVVGFPSKTRVHNFSRKPTCFIVLLV